MPVSDSPVPPPSMRATCASGARAATCRAAARLMADRASGVRHVHVDTIPGLDCPSCGATHEELVSAAHDAEDVADKQTALSAAKAEAESEAGESVSDLGVEAQGADHKGYSAVAKGPSLFAGPQYRLSPAEDVDEEEDEEETDPHLMHGLAI